ncbi:MAG TPA: GNAT family N-acetyltransferase [Anaerolineales bacterium]|nr:GNAT family N-acetyltransferase [Anaerolineales bacterium]
MMEIVPADIRDLTSLHQLEKACFAQDAWGIFDLIAVLTFPRVVRLKAIDKGKMIGFIAGDPRPSEGFSWIATVGVLPDYQRQGIGSALLLRCEEQLPTARVRLSVRISNDNAIRLYRREGYQTINIWEKYYNDDTDAVVMEKNRIVRGF